MNLVVNVTDTETCRWGIGKNGDLLCRFPEDMKWFKELTYGKTIICGHKTLDSFPGGKPLPGRKNIVITKNKDSISEVAKQSCDYYAFMKKLKKHNDSILTAVKHRIRPNVDPKKMTSLIVTDSIEDVLDIARIVSSNDNDIFVCGGASIYKQLLPKCDTCYVTFNDCKEIADTYFPSILSVDNGWRLSEVIQGNSYSSSTGINYCIDKFERI